MKAWQAWLDFVDERYRPEIARFPYCFILPIEEGPAAPEIATQQILQIAQSLLLLSLLRSRVACLEQTAIEIWLRASAQPTCAQIMHDFSEMASNTRSAALLKNAHDEFCDSIQQLAPDIDESAAQGVVRITEQFLSATDPAGRARRGVFFTHAIVARFIVRRVLSRLHAIRCENTASDALRFPRILDPSVGAGIFLVELLKGQFRLHCDEKKSAADGDSSQFHLQQVVASLYGADLMLASLLATHLNLANTLHEIGFDFTVAQRLHLFLTNTIADLAIPQQSVAEQSTRDLENQRMFSALRQQTFSAVVGNPPFAARSTNRGEWITQLLRGSLNQTHDDAREVQAGSSSYFEVNQRPLGERKVWLHDDYVKFFRYAQWQVERNGSGVLGFVTNRGLLDNLTFRGMRFQLLHAFDAIEIVDLHGDSRNRRPLRTPSLKAIKQTAEVPDENIFPIETGVAITILTRQANAEPKPADVSYHDSRGSRNEKLIQLEQDRLPAEITLRVAGDQYFWVPRDLRRQREYETGWRLSDVLQQAWSIPVTARDQFVVAFDREELLERLQAFVDLEKSDDTIRRQYFQRTRSRQYPAGDSRGWKLTTARRKITFDELCAAIRPCIYRPFDQRYIVWTDSLIDWSRASWVEQMRIAGNVSLIARRQAPAAASYNYFYATDKIVLDGILRSDNRGNESLYPLFIWSDQAEPISNFRNDFHEAAQKRWQFACRPEELFAYVYGLVHLPHYRVRYAAELAIDFPRVFLCRSAKSARAIMRIGQQLIQSHLMQGDNVPHAFHLHFAKDSDAAIEIGAGFPRYDSGKIHFHRDVFVAGVSPEIWNYRCGKHQIARKWLKDRRGRMLTSDGLSQYLRALHEIECTIRLNEQLAEMFNESNWTSEFL
jgi:predicted helicase